MNIELTLENIEDLLKDKSNKYKKCNILKNNEFLYSFDFDSNNNIYKIIDYDNNIIIRNSYNKDNIIESQRIIYEDNMTHCWYAIEENGIIVSEYISYGIIKNNKYMAYTIKSGIKYRFGGEYNKYLNKYKLNRLKSIFYNGFAYTVKSLNDGFEVYNDKVLVYKEIYNKYDQLIEVFIVDYNCMTNKFEYDNNKITRQKIYINRDLKFDIEYDYYSNNLLKEECINNNGNKYHIYYSYNSDKSISHIYTNTCIYEFMYSN